MTTQIELEKEKSKMRSRNLLRKIIRKQHRSSNSDPSVCYSNKIYSKLSV